MKTKLLNLEAAWGLTRVINLKKQLPSLLLKWCLLDLGTLRTRVIRKGHMHQGRSEDDVQHLVLHNPVDRERLDDLDDMAKTTGRKRSEMYRSAFKLPSIRVSDVRVFTP
ncbi:hypothetical protein TNCV_1867531 [Trichonephila clavipes]|nr:hypothetical protein TNCV_1867531 [Trichonephila clavipes]